MSCYKEMRYRDLFIGGVVTFFISILSCNLLNINNNLTSFIVGCLAMYAYPVVWIVYKFNRAQLSVMVFLRPAKLKIGEILMASIFPEFLSLGILLMLTAIITMISPAGEERQIAGNYTNWLTTTLGAVILAPICEEIIFRGFVLNKMLTRYSAIKSIVISSVVFGALHLDSGLSPTIMGVVLCVFYMKYKSIIPCIAIHSLHNFLGVLIKYWAFGSHALNSTPATTKPDPISLITLSVPLIIVGAIWIIYFVKINWKCVSSFDPFALDTH